MVATSCPFMHTSGQDHPLPRMQPYRVCPVCLSGGSWEVGRCLGAGCVVPVREGVEVLLLYIEGITGITGVTGVTGIPEIPFLPSLPPLR